MSWIKNTLKTVNDNSLNVKKQKQFGYLILVLLSIFLCVSIYKSGLIFNTKQTVVAILVAVFSMTTLFFSKGLYPLLIVWFLIGELLGSVTSFIILTIIYYIIFTPITMVLNIGNKKRRYSPKWIDRNNTINYEELS